METPNIAPNISPEPPKPKWFLSHKFLGYLMLFSVFAAIIALIYFWQVSNETSAINPFPVHLSKRDLNAYLPDYINLEYNFQFKYPATWAIYGDIRTYPVEFRKNETCKMYVGVDTKPENIDLKNWIAKTVNIDVSKLEVVTANTTSGFRADVSGIGQTDSVYLPLSETKVVSLSLYCGEDQALTEFNQVLSTFRINIDSQSAFEREPIDANITSWKIYKNSKYGFEFEYPDKKGINLRENQGDGHIAGVDTDGWDEYVAVYYTSKGYEEEISHRQANKNLDDLEFPMYESDQAITLANQKAHEFIYGTAIGLTQKVIVAKTSLATILVFVQTPGGYDYPSTDHILSSFKLY